MSEALQLVLPRFQLRGRAVSCEPYGKGHINQTYLAVTDRGSRYILQKISTAAFPDVAGLMENITSVTTYLNQREADPRATMHVIPTGAGTSYLELNGEYWRVYDFVEDTICLQTPETDADFYESAVGFGRFQSLLAGFPADRLHETIRNFHNTPDRYRLFREVLERDPLGRAAGVRREIEFALEREAEMGTLQRLRESGELPLRVTHNDSKLNNVLLDARTRKAVCVIDLDTVMPGLSVYDFGDSIRFGAATAAEDERDLSLVKLSLPRYRCYAGGFFTACQGLTAAELQMMPMGAKVMTLECGLRFLTDYLDGDRYFSISRPEQNLDRARTQFALTADMEQKWDALQTITEEES